MTIKWFVEETGILELAVLFRERLNVLTALMAVD